MKKAIWIFLLLCSVTSCVTAQTETVYPEGLKVGDAAPMFTAKDQNGKDYYKVKNSWGVTNDYKGYLYVTKAFVQLKSTGILLNKAGIPKATKTKIRV